LGEKFAGKYRIKTTRLQNWDYGRNGNYFVTICTGGRDCFFGTKRNNELILSESGFLAKQIWLDIPNYFSYILLHEYVIMPNHVHGILEIHNRRDAINRVSKSTETNLNEEDIPDTKRRKGGITGKNNPMLYPNLSRVIRWYKGRVTHEIRKNQKDFNWQSRFYDHVIQDNRSLNAIRKYIKDNPEKWTNDELNPDYKKQNE
jgi:putative transposase